MPYFALVLNDMRCPKSEQGDAVVAWAETREPLEAYLEAELVEPYRDDRWHKVFRKDGPLEWFNNMTMTTPGFEKIVEIPTPDEAAAAAHKQMARQLMSVPKLFP